MVRLKKVGLGSSNTSIMEPPSEEEFYQCSVRGMKSAIKLAAWSAGVSEESLEAAYMENGSKLISVLDANAPFHEWERDEQEEWEADEAAENETSDTNAKGKWQELLQRVRDEAAQDPQGLESNMDDEADDKDHAEDETNADGAAPPFDNIPDGQDLRSLFAAVEPEADDAEQPAGGNQVEAKNLYCNLHDAMLACSDGTSVETFDKVWRLLMYLRHWAGGMDRHFIKNPRAARRKSSTLNWYQCLGLLSDVLVFFTIFHNVSVLF